MKKIFTIAAAILASFSLWAQEPAIALTAKTSEIADWNQTYDNVKINVQGAALASKKPCGVTVNENALSISSSDSHWIEISCPEGLNKIVIAGSGNSTGTTDWAAPLCACANAPFDSTIIGILEVHYTGYDKDCAENELLLPEGTKSVRLYRRMKVNSEGTKVGSGSNWTPATASGNQTFNITYLEVYAGAAAPVTDPVTSVVIDGDAAGYVGGSSKLTATTDAKADSLYWTVDGAVQENSNSKTFTLALEAARTYSVVCYARNQYNEADKFAASEVFNVVATEKPVLEQVVVTDDMTWDFSKAASVSEIKWTGADKDAAPVLLANVDGMNNNAEFNSQALLFSGEYPIRDGKYCQGPHLEFKINAPGLMSVEYSNTGNRSAAEGETEGQEALRRFLTVNGNLVPGDAGTMKSNANTTVVDIVVAPGDVVISSVMPYSDKPTDAQYIRIYKVAYQRKGWPTAIENTDAAVKAVKVVRDGQMMILKNGVLYNMQGAVVK